MANQVYTNQFLSNTVEDQFNSHLDLQQFCTVDNSLEGTAGMKRVINTYRATDGTQILGIGQGNDKSIEVSYTPVEYDIKLAQNRFVWNDEHEMTDPMLVPVGMKHAGTDMFNTVNADVYLAFDETAVIIEVPDLDFPAFVDASAALNIENPEGVFKFALVHPKDVAEIRKNMQQHLQYVEAFAKRGYVGTLADIHIYATNEATEGEPIVATRDAVTIFNKKGVEIERERDANTRVNSAYARKYYIVALTDASKAVKLHVQA